MLPLSAVELNAARLKAKNFGSDWLHDKQPISSISFRTLAEQSTVEIYCINSTLCHHVGQTRNATFFSWHEQYLFTARKRRADEKWSGLLNRQLRVIETNSSHQVRRRIYCRPRDSFINSSAADHRWDARTPFNFCLMFRGVSAARFCNLAMMDGGGGAERGRAGAGASAVSRSLAPALLFWLYCHDYKGCSASLKFAPQSTRKSNPNLRTLHLVAVSILWSAHVYCTQHFVTSEHGWEHLFDKHTNTRADGMNKEEQHRTVHEHKEQLRWARCDLRCIPITACAFWSLCVSVAMCFGCYVFWLLCWSPWWYDFDIKTKNICLFLSCTFFHNIFNRVPTLFFAKYPFGTFA